MQKDKNPYKYVGKLSIYTVEPGKRDPIIPRAAEEKNSRVKEGHNRAPEDRQSALAGSAERNPQAKLDRNSGHATMVDVHHHLRLFFHLLPRFRYGDGAPGCQPRAVGQLPRPPAVRSHRPKLIWSLLAVLFLAGCTSAEEERRKATEAHEARQAYYHQRCIEYGLTSGTDAYANCRQRFDALDRQERTMKRGLVIQHLLGR